MPILINKPKDFTSHDVVAVARGKLGIKKIGHAGTLDPLATGLLILLVGRAETKQQDAFMNLGKEYVAEITLGKVSETYDAQGPITESADSVEVTQEQIEQALEKFTGTIQQKPPIHSAVHLDGQRLYKLARKGKVDASMVPSREVSVYEIELLEYNKPVIKVRISCGKGTYIRSLAHDLGQELGVGAYLSELVRTKIGPHELKDAIELDKLSASDYSGDNEATSAN
ncbi:MAG: tRNA pseudouridine(55) synthase TruB [bacterium]|nr:tRNA pseudouridine(55) synthase TruB [bacterium]